jgi:hypothetical protein
VNIERKIKNIIEDDLANSNEANRYLLAAIFKNRPN